MKEESYDNKEEILESDNTNESVNEETGTEDVESIKTLLQEKEKQCSEYFDRLQRTAAEFDNYKKRTLKERESVYMTAVAETVAAFLPVVDSIDRAINLCIKENADNAVKEGIELIKRQLEDVMKNLGVEEIKCIGESFDPELHNAVMHVEDENYGANTIVEELQKGYKMNDRVIRYSMVKVAN
jgi:molecular chaperone GrpE